MCLRALRARIGQTSLPRGDSAAGVQGPSLEDGDSHSPCRQLPPSEVRRLWAVPAIPAPQRPFLLHPREGESARGQKRPGTLHNSLHMEKTWGEGKAAPFSRSFTVATSPPVSPSGSPPSPQRPSEHSVPLKNALPFLCGLVNSCWPLSFQCSAGASCPQARPFCLLPPTPRPVSCTPLLHRMCHSCNLTRCVWVWLLG